MEQSYGDLMPFHEKKYFDNYARDILKRNF